MQKSDFKNHYLTLDILSFGRIQNKKLKIYHKIQSNNSRINNNKYVYISLTDDHIVSQFTN